MSENFKEYTLPEYINKINSGEIKIPEIQREYVWNKDKRKKLLESIKKGFPIGCLTMACYLEDKNNSNVKYIIDGLQRTISLKNLYNNILKFIDKKEFIQFWEEKIWNTTRRKDEEITKSIEKDINKIYDIALLKEFIDFNTEEKKFLEEKEREMLTSENKELLERLFIMAYENYFNNVLKLNNYKIYCIIYRGNGKEISDVFVQMNEQGEPLKEIDIIKSKCFDKKINANIFSKDEYNKILSDINHLNKKMYNNEFGKDVIKNIEYINIYYLSFFIYAKKLEGLKNIYNNFLEQKKPKEKIKIEFFFNVLFIISFNFKDIYLQNKKIDSIEKMGNSDLFENLYDTIIINRNEYDKFINALIKTCKFLSSFKWNDIFFIGEKKMFNFATNKSCLNSLILAIFDKYYNNIEPSCTKDINAFLFRNMFYNFHKTFSQSSTLNIRKKINEEGKYFIIKEFNKSDLSLFLNEIYGSQEKIAKVVLFGFIYFISKNLFDGKNIRVINIFENYNNGYYKFHPLNTIFMEKNNENLPKFYLGKEWAEKYDLLFIKCKDQEVKREYIEFITNNFNEYTEKNIDQNKIDKLFELRKKIIINGYN